MHRTLEDIFKARDAVGHEHGADGRFGNTGGGAKPAKAAPKTAPIRHAGFTIGGAGSGKGRLAKEMAERLGITNVIEPDAIKQSIPGYSNREGDGKGYGSSGPRTNAELAAYPPELRAALEAHVRENTEFPDVASFGKYLREKDGLADHEHFADGITHELSSHIAKSRLAKALDEGSSFIFDACGGPRHEAYIKQALAKGMHVTAEHAAVPLAVALHRNDGRDRSLEINAAIKSHKKANKAAASIKRLAALHPNDVTFTAKKTYRPEHVEEARAAGFTDTGYTPPTEKSLTLADIMKADDAGHAHGEDGKFVATGTKRINHAGGGMTLAKTKRSYTFKPHATGVTVHDDHTGTQVGHVEHKADRGRTIHEGVYTGGKKPKVVTSVNSPGGPDAEHTEHAARAVALEHFRGTIKRSKSTQTAREAAGYEKSLTIGDIMPLTLEDIMKGEGTAHDPSTGQFTAGNGYSGTIKSSSGTKYGIKVARKKEAHVDRFSGEPVKTMHENYHLHDDQGNHIGHVSKHQTAKYSHERHAYAHDGTHLGSSNVAHGNKDLDTSRLKGLLQRVTDHHEKTKAASTGKKPSPLAGKSLRDQVQIGHDMEHGPWDKALTIGDIMKGDDPAPGDALTDFPGSYEEMLQRIRGPVCAGSGCSDPPTYSETGSSNYAPSPVGGDAPHYLSVVATFPEHAYVRCNDEALTWKVPYTIDESGAITTGAPEEAVAVFKPTGLADDEDDLADETDAA